MTPAVLRAVQAARAAGQPVVLATRLPDGEQRLLPDPAHPALTRAAEQALATERSGTQEVEGANWFLHAHNPPARLVIVGAVPIAQAVTA